MFDIIKKLIFSRQISFEKGRITLLGQPLVMQPAVLFSQLKKRLVKSKMNKDFIYLSAKETGKIYMSSIMKKYSMNFHDSMQWAVNSIEASGWGITELINTSLKKKTAIVHVKDSQIAKLYGHSKIPVDDTLRGFFAGGAAASLKEDMECKETQCISKGDRICEFVIYPKKAKVKKYK